MSRLVLAGNCCAKRGSFTFGALVGYFCTGDFHIEYHSRVKSSIPMYRRSWRGIAWVLFVAYIFGRKERKRLGVVDFDYQHHSSLTEEQKSFRRPKLIWLNAVMTVSIDCDFNDGLDACTRFICDGKCDCSIDQLSCITDQQKILKSHGANIFLVSSMIFAAGIFSGILTGSKMIEAMASSLVYLIPEHHANLLPVLTAVTSMPASMLFTPDAYYFGVVPVLSQTAQHYKLIRWKLVALHC